MRLLCLFAITACSASNDYGASSLPDAGHASADGGFVGCLSSNECPAGTYCNEFGRCVAPPPPGDGGMPPPPPEVEYDFGEPISSQRFVYVAMTAQDELARI